MHRTFVAVWPDVDVVRSVRQLTIPVVDGVRAVPAENWHITLRFLGDLSDDELAGVIDALDDARLPCAHVAMGPRLERLGGRQIVVPVDGVDDLARAVRQATAAYGRRDERPFLGHLTIARVARGAEPDVEAIAFRAEQAITEIAVVTSDLLATGAAYTTVHRRRLDQNPT